MLRRLLPTGSFLALSAASPVLRTFVQRILLHTGLLVLARHLGRGTELPPYIACTAITRHVVVYLTLRSQ